MKPKKKNFINMRLLWEYEPQNFDVEKNCGIIVQRVIERGLKKDFVAIENQYGRNKIRQIIKNKIKYLNDKDMNFASVYYNVKKEDMMCYKNKRKKESMLGIKIKREFQG